ncbi:hypothetical protein MRX96_018227 [Rhipicephalus microplus]
MAPRFASTAFVAKGGSELMRPARIRKMLSARHLRRARYATARPNDVHDEQDAAKGGNTPQEKKKDGTIAAFSCAAVMESLAHWGRKLRHCSSAAPACGRPICQRACRKPRTNVAFACANRRRRRRCAERAHFAVASG